MPKISHCVDSIVGLQSALDKSKFSYLAQNADSTGVNGYSKIQIHFIFMSTLGGHVFVKNNPLIVLVDKDK